MALVPAASRASTDPAAGAAAAVVAFGRTVTIPVEPVNALRVIALAPRTLASTTGPSPSQVTPPAFASSPHPSRPTSAPATSRPSLVAPSRMWVTPSPASRAASAVACGAQVWSPAAADVTETTRGRYVASSAAAASGAASTTSPAAVPPDCSASARASVASSVESRVSAPSATSATTRIDGAIR